MKEIVRLALIDRYQLFREGIKMILESYETFQIVIESEHFAMLEDARSLKSLDVLLIDVGLLSAHQDDIEQMIEEEGIKVIVFADKGEEVFVTDAIKLGVHGFLFKEMDKYSFIEAIHLVLSGTAYIHPNATHDLVEDYRHLANLNEHETINIQDQAPDRLYSKREGEILQLLTDGQSNRKIAETLEISEKTVKNHVSSLFKKLQVNDRTQAVVMAIKNNWVEL